MIIVIIIIQLCVLSDLLLELNHYEWVLGILLEFMHNHSPEDDILAEYLIPTLCKALAVLRLVCKLFLYKVICKNASQALIITHPSAEAVMSGNKCH